MAKHQAAQWPRSYLLQVHEQAIAEGCIRLAVPDPAKARSLIAALYRIRRRGDSQHKLGFIKPEYHLVMAQHEPERGTVLVLFDALPDGLDLPEILSVPKSERTQLSKVQAPLPAVKAAAAAELDAADIDSVVEQLAAEAQLKHGSDPDPQL